MIILQADLSKFESKIEQNKTTFKSQIKAFQGLFEKAPSLIQEIDPDDAKYNYLKEKYHL